MDMTGETPHEYQPNPLDALRDATIDVTLADVLANVDEAQAQLDGEEHPTEWRTISAALEPVNELWQSTKYTGTVGYFSGKLRRTFHEHDNTPAMNELLGQLPAGQDESGDYWLADNVPMVSSYFAIAQTRKNKLDPDARIGLSLLLPEDYDEDDENNPLDTGDLLMYPDEITRAEFTRPSADAIERQLAYYFPDLLHRLHQELPGGDNPSTQEITEFLQNFYVPADESRYGDYPIADRLATYIYDKLNFDDEHYRVSVDGPLLSVDTDERDIESTPGRDHLRSIRGIVCGIQMLRDDEVREGEPVYRPHLLLAIPEPAKHGDFYACIVPPESLVGLNSLRSSYPEFGKKASLLTFFSPADVADFFASPMMPVYTPPEQPPSNPTTGRFNQVIDGLQDELPEFLPYDKRHMRHTVSVRRDMSRVANDFADHIVAFGKARPDRPLTNDDYVKIEKKMLATYDHLHEIVIGDTLATRGEVMAIDEPEKNVADFLSLHADLSLQGTFQGFKILGHPIIALKPGVGPERVGEVVDMNICVILSDCKVVNGEGIDQLYPFVAEHIMLPVTTSNTDHFVKLEPTDDSSEEGTR